MLRKAVEFGPPGTQLSVAHRQLVVAPPDHVNATLPIEDLGVVIVDDACPTYTQAVFIELLLAGATIMITGRDHLPVEVMLPLDAHHIQTERHLAHFTGDHGGLLPMSRRVRSGDPDNLEAQAAQRYRPCLFGKEFGRDRDIEGINALLNYGYAVIRAAIARSFVASGLIPSPDVFHRNRSNPFCLADDLLKPCRPLVGWLVKTDCRRKQTKHPQL